MFARNALILVAVAAMLSLASATASAATVGYWNAQSGGITLTDLTGNGNNLTSGIGLVSSAVNVAPNPVPNPDGVTTGASGSVLFGTSYSAAPRITGASAAAFEMTNASSFTFEGWVSGVASSTSGYIASDRHQNGSPGYRGWFVRLNVNGLQYYSNANGGTASAINSTSDVLDGISSGHHFAAVWDHDAGAGVGEGVMSLYIDGLLEGTQTMTPAAYTSAAFSIGGRDGTTAGSGYVDNLLSPGNTARLDEMRFSDQALSPSQFLNTTPVAAPGVVLVDINADGTNRHATTADFEAATGLAAGTFTGGSLTAFYNNNPGVGAYSQTVDDITVAVSDITNDADGWFGAGTDNNLLEDGLYLRGDTADPSALITLSGVGLGLEPERMYELYLFAGRNFPAGSSVGHETTFTFDVDNLLDPSGGLAIDVGVPVVGGDNTLGTAPFTFSTGSIVPSSLVIQWDGLQNIDGDQDAVFSGFALRDIGAAAVIPEPSTMALAVLGLLGLLVTRRRRR